MELIRQSLLAMGRCAPNPAVACVVELKSEKNPSHTLLFAGATEKPGGRHAEIVALDAVDNYQKQQSPVALPQDPRSIESEIKMWVTLEPCSKHGRTPPCTTRILETAAVKQVRIDRLDPTLAGEGLAILTRGDRSPETSSGPAENLVGRTFLHGFEKRVLQTGRRQSEKVPSARGPSPRLHFKAAVSADGYMGVHQRRAGISGLQSGIFTMLLRAVVDAVVVGPGTIQTDHPSLNVRFPEIYHPFGIHRGGMHWESSLGAGTIPEQLLCGEGDLLIRSLFYYYKEIMERNLSLPHDYEVDRVFIMGEPFTGLENFLQKQEELTAATGRPARYYTLSDSPGIRGYLPDEQGMLPSMEDPLFSSQLRHALAGSGYNEVLVEGGAGLFDSLLKQRVLLTGDRAYVVRSPHNLELRQGETPVALPDGLASGPLVDRIISGEDEIHVHHFE